MFDKVLNTLLWVQFYFHYFKKCDEDVNAAFITILRNSRVVWKRLPNSFIHMWHVHQRATWVSDELKFRLYGQTFRGKFVQLFCSYFAHILSSILSKFLKMLCSRKLTDRSFYLILLLYHCGIIEFIISPISD